MLQESIQLKSSKRRNNPTSDGLKMGDFLWISGQLPINQETGQMIDGDIQAQTEQTMNNIIELLTTQSLCADHIMRTTIFMTDMNEYDQMNQAYAKFFEDVYPARSVIGVNALPGGAKIEIECYALDTRALEVLCENEEDGHDDGSCCGCCG